MCDDNEDDRDRRSCGRQETCDEEQVFEERYREDTRVRASLERDHRGLGPGRRFDKISKDDDVNVESRNAVALEKEKIVHLRQDK